MAEKRYYVDLRRGCMAVRDREQTEPDYPGLHFDTKGVLLYWHEPAQGKGIDQYYVDQAENICNMLNGCNSSTDLYAITRMDDEGAQKVIGIFSRDNLAEACFKLKDQLQKIGYSNIELNYRNFTMDMKAVSPTGEKEFYYSGSYIMGEFQL